MFILVIYNHPRLRSSKRLQPARPARNEPLATPGPSIIWRGIIRLGDILIRNESSLDHLESRFCCVCGVASCRVVACKGAGRESALPGVYRACPGNVDRQSPSGDRWLHEVKFDGYRVQLHIHARDIRIYTRNGNDWTDRFQKVAHEAWHTNAKSALHRRRDRRSERTSVLCPDDRERGVLSV